MITELGREDGRIVTKGEFWMLTSTGRQPQSRPRAEADLSSTDGGWLRVESAEDQAAASHLTRRARAAAAATGLGPTAHVIEVPPAAELGG